MADAPFAAGSTGSARLLSDADGKPSPSGATSDLDPASARAATLVDTSRRSDAITLSSATTLVRGPKSAAPDSLPTSIAETIARARTVAVSRALVADSHGKPGEFSEGDSEPRAVAVGPSSGESFDAGVRYGMRRILGEGGMGEVRLSHDAFIGRDVAMKVIRASQGSMSDARARFLREARVQGQLEHPAIVPVYDLGVTSEGEVFFTMKRIVGFTVEEIIEGSNARRPTSPRGSRGAKSSPR